MKQLTQSQRSILAVVFTALFLITGKAFVWKSGKAAPVQPDSGSPAAEVPQETAQTESIPAVPGTTAFIQAEVTQTATQPFVPIEQNTVITLTTTESDAALIPGTTVSVTQLSSTTAVSSAAQTTQTTAAAVTEPPAAPTADFSDALFIGDSRGLGMALYAPIDGATYFATVGLAAYKIDTVTSEAPETKGQTFQQVLTARTYGKVYIILGINELGNDFNSTMQHYRDLIQRIQQAQPGAVICLQGNLHVAYSRSANDAIVNNSVINNFNSALADMADQKKIFYQDVNPLFDDENGCLAAEYTSDGTHPYAKHYDTWRQYLLEHPVK